MSTFATDAVTWAASRWAAEVKNRPLQNIHRRTLDTTWRQVIRHFGGDDVALCGPAHDETDIKELVERVSNACVPMTYTLSCDIVTALTTLSSEVERMRGALEQAATIAENYDPDWDNESPHTTSFNIARAIRAAKDT